MGYTNINEYAGGKKDWMRARLPIEGEAARMRPKRVA
jgi:hypothetical protein